MLQVAGLSCLLLAQLVLGAFLRSSTRVIEIPGGLIKGIEWKIDGTTLPNVDIFFNIPYGSLPTTGGIQSNRFSYCRGPQSKPWNNTIIRLKARKACAQMTVDYTLLRETWNNWKLERLKQILSGSMDREEMCLRLGIYVPKQPRDEQPVDLAVIVLIQTESYSNGAPNSYDPSLIASFGNVIVVNINFRLGVLGFLSDGTRNSPGNLALVDIVAALKWLKAHIRKFGGDPNLVTLMGQGYGAALIHILMKETQMTRGRDKLFHHAIAMSGSAYAPWAVSRSPDKSARMLARNSCPPALDGNSLKVRQLHECLREISVSEVLEHERKVVEELASPYETVFGPVAGIAGTAFDFDLQKNTRPEDYKLLIGTVANEGVDYLSENQLVLGVSDEEQTKVITELLRSFYTFNEYNLAQKKRLEEMVSVLKQIYILKGTATNKARADALVKLLGDSLVYLPVLRAAEEHATGGRNTYLYLLEQQTRLGVPHRPRWLSSLKGDDLALVFGAPLADIRPFNAAVGSARGSAAQPGGGKDSFTVPDRRISEAMIIYWTNFAKTGNPMEPVKQGQHPLEEDAGENNKFKEIVWNKLTASNFARLKISAKPSMESSLSSDAETKRRIWTEILPKMFNDEPVDLGQFNVVRGTTIPPPPPPPPPGPGTKRNVVDSTASPATAPLGGTTKSSTLPTQPSSNSTQVDSAPSSVPLSLSIAIAVGCSLLLVNLLILIAVYCHRKKLRRRRRRPNSDNKQHETLLAAQQGRWAAERSQLPQERNGFKPGLPLGKIPAAKDAAAPTSPRGPSLDRAAETSEDIPLGYTTSESADQDDYAVVAGSSHGLSATLLTSTRVTPPAPPLSPGPPPAPPELPRPVGVSIRRVKPPPVPPKPHGRIEVSRSLLLQTAYTPGIGNAGHSYSHRSPETGQLSQSIVYTPSHNFDSPNPNHVTDQLSPDQLIEQLRDSSSATSPDPNRTTVV